MSSKKKVFKLIERRSTESTVKNRNSWTFTIAVLGITGTICFLLITEKVDIDSSTLLSLILAFFSIYLSAQFYFKATEQSNQFYNTAFNHNKNISESLSGMKGEFGTSLRMIEESSNYLKGKFDELGKISESVDSLNEVQAEVSKAFENLSEKSGLTADEKEEYNKLFATQSQIVEQLESKLKEVEVMNHDRMRVESKNISINNMKAQKLLLMKFIFPFYNQYGNIISSADISKSSLNRIFHEFNSSGYLTEEVYEELIRGKYIDSSGNLTGNGYFLIKDSVQKYQH